MRELEAVLELLSPTQRRILIRLLKAGAGPWPSARPVAGGELLASLSDADQPLAHEALDLLASQNLVRSAMDKLLLSDMGYSAAVELQRLRVAEPSVGLLPSAPPRDERFPWSLSNPRSTPWRMAEAFVSDLRVARRDGRIRRLLVKHMEAVLAGPDHYGKTLAAGRHGQRECYADNYRLIWTSRGNLVQFELFRSKEDRSVSPFGA